MTLVQKKQIIYFDRLVVCPNCGKETDFYNIFEDENAQEVSRCFLCHDDIKNKKIENAPDYEEILLYDDGTTMINGKPVERSILPKELQ